MYALWKQRPYFYPVSLFKSNLLHNWRCGDRKSNSVALCGCIETFDRSSESWEQYYKRINHIFEANEIANHEVGLRKRRNILLGVCDSKVYKLMSSLLSLNKPGDLTYEEFVSFMKSYYNPKSYIEVKRFKFYMRGFQREKSILDFVEELCCITEDNCFWAFLDEMLREKHVVGLNNDTIMRRLLAEKDNDISRSL